MSCENSEEALTSILEQSDIAPLIRGWLEGGGELDTGLLTQAILHCLDRIEALEAINDGRDDYRGADRD